tara:strand:- start:190 stop:585 length:396 start_codon:yes stop_codon:yes gene_type:complete
MKKTIFAGLVLGLVAGGAMAACPGAAVGTAGATLSGQLIVDSMGSGREVHCPGGNLVELAKGVGDPVDPTRIVGTWSTTGSAVTYNYSGGSSYTFTLHKNGSTYNFCTGSGSSAVVKASGPLTAGSCAGAL